MTEFPPSQAATALVQVLQGEARDMCNDYPLPVLTNGRVSENGQHIDPVTMILEDLTRSTTNSRHSADMQTKGSTE